MDNQDQHPDHPHRHLNPVGQVDDRLAGLRRYAVEASSRLEEVRRMYKQMIEDAEAVYQENERAYRNLRRIRYELMSRRSVSDLVRTLVAELEKMNIDHVSLDLADDLLDYRNEALGMAEPDVDAHLALISRDEIEAAFSSGDLYSVYIGPARAARPGVFQTAVTSCIACPLVFQDRLIGGLYLGSHDPNRFTPDMATDLIEDLAATAALCLDNVITHEINQSLAATDPLTGVYNRRYFFGCAARQFDMARRHGDHLSCLYLDLDGFKPINDRYGHEAGDMVLKRLTGFITGRTRKTDVFARMGGDEFALLLPRVDIDQARSLAAELTAGLAAIDLAEDGLPGVAIAASIGAASLEPEDRGLEDLTGRADQAMYRAKAERRPD
jgi:diguanylate cyclase (GGDEF)-like protein